MTSRIPKNKEDEALTMANCLMLLSRADRTASSEGTNTFTCKTCKRAFHSFQALGGHRGSHKKPRLIESAGEFFHVRKTRSVPSRFQRSQDLPLSPHCYSDQTNPLSDSCCWITHNSARSISRMEYYPSRQDLYSESDSWSESGNMIQGKHGDQAYISSEEYSQTVGGNSSQTVDSVHLADTGNRNPIVQTRRSTDDHWGKLAKIVLGVSTAAGYTSSSNFPAAANAVSFIASLTAISLRRSGGTATMILAKLGAIVCAAGTLAAIGKDLSEEYRWVAGVAFLIPATVVAFA